MSNSEPPSSSQPLAEYKRRLAETEELSSRLDGRDSFLSTLRWVSFVVLIVFLGLGAKEVVSAWLVLIPLVVFVIAIIAHGRFRKQRELSRRRVKIYEQGVARLNDEWTGERSSGERYKDPAHVYSGDLDLFGDGSLFQLVCCARTRAGEDRLAEWLLSPAEKSTIQKRQDAVSELRDNVRLREELALLDSGVSESLDQNKLKEWAAEPGQPIPAGPRIAACILSAFSIVGVILWLGTEIGATFLIAVLLIQIPFLFVLRHRVFRVAQGMDDADAGLHTLAQVLSLIESRDFNSESLTHVRRRLDVDGRPPSKTVRYLAKRIGYLNNSLKNQFFAPIGIVLCLPLHLAHSIEQWRLSVGKYIATWLDAVGDFEAAVSLGGYWYEHPQYITPTISDEPTTFVAEEIGHPLLPASQCVRNSVDMDSDRQLLLISGSNMSGKSTLLRTVGTNTVLALAGSVVNAKAMTVSRLQVGTAMRVSDSLQEGKSLFFAVLGRLKSVVDLAGQEQPLLFLLDEILQGTNSHDRRIGAEAVIRSLVDREAIGMVTTHDLALTDIGDSISGTRNVHFADSLNDGEMTFDYHLRPGVVQRSNAIELMRLVGLDV